MNVKRNVHSLNKLPRSHIFYFINKIKCL